MKPLLLVTCSRSGSSLLTRILGKHGLWTGDCLGKDKTGYETYENEQVSSFIKNKWPNPSRIKPVPNSSVKFRSFILSIIPPKERAVTFTTCPECGGTRLTREALASTIRGKNIADLCAMQISDLAGWVRGLDEPSVAPLVAGVRTESLSATRSSKWRPVTVPLARRPSTVPS